jgi:hypothetical protein
MTQVPGSFLDTFTSEIDRLTELLSESLLVSRYIREAAADGRTKDVINLAADQERLAAALCEVAADFDKTSADLRENGIGLGGLTIPEVCEVIDRTFGSRLMERCEKIAETLGEMCLLSSTNSKLFDLLRWWYGATFRVLTDTAGMQIGYGHDGTCVLSGFAVSKTRFSF